MNIVIVANFPSILDGGVKGRFINLAMILHERGHEVEVIVSDFSHSVKRFRDQLSNPYPFKLTYIHEIGYPKNICLKRLLSHYLWGVNVKKYISTLSCKPDLVYAALPTFTAGRLVGRWCNKAGIKYIIDVQDLWPEAFKVAFNNIIINQMFRPMDWVANSAYKSADFIIGVSNTYRDRALVVNKKNKTGITVYLGSDGAKFDKAKIEYNVEKPISELWVAYVGTMGYSYDLECAIDAIKCANTQNDLPCTVKLVAMGDGPLFNRFSSYAQEQGIPNLFTGALAYDKMVGLLCSCDIVINCLRKGAAQSITNKVGDYALCGKPVVNTQENQEYRDLVSWYNCGINCECGNSYDVADAIILLATDSKLRQEMGKNARLLGIERFDRRTSYLEIIKTIEAL